MVLLIGVAVTAGLCAAGNQDSAEQPPSLSLPGHLVDGDTLEGLIAENAPVILDTARSEADFAAAHLPGALYAPREAYWQEVNGIPGMFPVVDITVAWLESLGISDNTPVVIYDSGAGLWAARVAWTLAYLGHDNWAVLDGGIGLWQAEGRPLSTGAPSQTAVSAGSFTPSVRDELLVDGDDILSSLENPDYVVVDTRSPGEYDGSDVRAARGGHIPGSLPIEWTLNNESSSLPILLSSEELGEFYASQGVDTGDQVVTLCQTGVRGAHTWLALTLAGYENVALYDGSWAHWAADERYPVEK